MIDLNYYSLSLFLGGIVALASGAVVFFAPEGRGNKISMPFMCLNLATALWSFGYFAMITAAARRDALFANWILHFGAILIPIFYFWFVTALTGTTGKYRLELRIFLAVAFLMILINPTTAFVRAVSPKYIFNYAPDAGPLYIYFTIYFFAVVIFALIVFFNRIRSANLKELTRLRYAFGASVAGFVGGGSVFFLTFNVPLPPYPIILFSFYPLITAYAILRHGLFSIKVVMTEFLTFALWILLLFRVILAENLYDQLINLGLFIGSVLLGIFLILSVYKEVEQRELIEKQEKELELANQRQETLLHFISHEVKGYLTKSEAGFAAIAEGDFGMISPQLRDMANAALADVRKGVATVMYILGASNFKKGTVSYKKLAFDFKAAVLAIVAQLRPLAYEKHLGFEAGIGDGRYSMQGDEEKLREHVIRNLIDNAIRYTRAGTVRVTLSESGGKIRFAVQDSGVGITQEDMAHLFTEGGRGKDSLKINVHSTGYGLYIAKQVVLAHGGKIWAESDGQGTGSRFIVELPAS